MAVFQAELDATHLAVTWPSQAVCSRPAMELLQRLKNYDAYPKTLEDFRVRTFSGAAGAS